MPTKKPLKKKTPKKTAKKKSTKKKPGLVCAVCGMEVIVDRTCGCAEAHSLICCGQPMTSK